MNTSAAETDQIYASAASSYDRLTWLLSFGSGGFYRRKIVKWLDLPVGGVGLDVGSGTGGLAHAMQETVGDSGRAVAIDRSPEMLAEARRRGVRETVEGTFDALPVSSQTVDGLVSGYAIRYAPNLEEALREMHRVLKPGAKIALLEMAIPRSRAGRAAASLLVRRLSPPAMTLCCQSRGAGALMRHFWESVASFPPMETVVETMKGVGFTNVQTFGPWGMLTEFRARA